MYLPYWQETKGGALYLEKDTSATFMGTARFIRNSVISTDLPSVPAPSGGTRNVFIIRSGGAVFNKVGYIHTRVQPVCGSYINTRNGHSCKRGTYGFPHVFAYRKESYRAPSCRSPVPKICVNLYYQGELVFESAAVFSSNEAVTTDSTNEGRGGAIYNARIGTITFNGRLTANKNNADVRTHQHRCYRRINVLTHALL